ncbi:hypothetical protein ACFYZ8_33365 [Streptomyces sp. NPDC001668]|uniref:hypothetical protein n=1 Tax=Streptomyces sp. NPDC001668 TaxID=3364598 RepID=UPI0036824ED8
MDISAQSALHVALLAHADSADPEHPATTAALHLLRLADGHGPAPSRGTDASRALTEVRTVLSRARTARAALDRPTEHQYGEDGRPLHDPVTNEWVVLNDPDAQEMRAALDTVIAVLERWDRTGRTRRPTSR